MSKFRYIYALDATDQAIQRIDIGAKTYSTVVTGLDSVPDGIVVDPGREYIYWTNMGVPALIREDGPLDESNLNFYGKNGSIERIGLDGNGRTTILPPGSFVTGKQLAGAWASGRLYWSDREGAAVRSARLDGTDLRDEVIVGVTEAEQREVRNQCVGVAVDERNGYLYWTQKGPSKGGDGRIFRTSLEMPAGQNAEEREIEVLWSQLPEPIDLELDLDAGLIYWTDRGGPPYGNTLNKSAIPKAGEAGGSAVLLASGFHEAIGLAVDKVAGIAYVGDLLGEIRAVKLDGSGESVLEKVPGRITGIAGV